MVKSMELDKILNLLLRAEEYNGKVDVLPRDLADQLGYLIEAIEDECYHTAMAEPADETA